MVQVGDCQQGDYCFVVWQGVYVVVGYGGDVVQDFEWNIGGVGGGDKGFGYCCQGDVYFFGG